jgi:hypothetical protein
LIVIDVGDPVIVKMKFDDGWGYGYNMTTKLEGTFPLACVAPFDRSERGDQWEDGSGASMSRSSFSIRKRESSMYGPDNSAAAYRDSRFTEATGITEN